MIARGITLSSASVPATICSIPICMRREAHYVATLMWEEGAGERWGGRGRDEGNGALEARRTARRDFSGGFFGSACSVRLEGGGGVGGGGGDEGRGRMDGQRFKAEEAQSSTIAQFTTGVLGRSPENKRGHLKKGRNKRSIHPNGQ